MSQLSLLSVAITPGKDELLTSKIHVADGASRKHQTCQHFGQVIGSNTVSVAGIEQATLRDKSVRQLCHGF